MASRAKGASYEELKVMCIADIINELLRAHDEGRDVNLNKIKSQISSKYGLASSPKLVDIIAAVPHQHRKVLVPKLKAKPIRTASGVSWQPTPFNSYITNVTITRKRPTL